MPNFNVFLFKWCCLLTTTKKRLKIILNETSAEISQFFFNASFSLHLKAIHRIIFLSFFLVISSTKLIDKRSESKEKFKYKVSKSFTHLSATIHFTLFFYEGEVFEVFSDSVDFTPLHYLGFFREWNLMN